MDWGTHMVLAAKLLKSSDLDVGAAVYSVIPVIDQKPAHFHRVYAHILENQPDFLDISIELFGSPEVRRRDFKALDNLIKAKTERLQKELDNAPLNLERRRKIEKRIYALTRIGEETPEFIRLLDEAQALIGDPRISKISQDKVSCAVSLLSHTFFDTFNNPVQVFLPASSYCSAQWELWAGIDYMQFRGEFYKKENLDLFRKEIANNEVWNVRLRPEALIKAIIIKLGELGQPAIPYEVVDMGIRDFMRYMDIDEYQRADSELKFLSDLEAQMRSIIYRNFSLNGAYTHER